MYIHGDLGWLFRPQAPSNEDNRRPRVHQLNPRQDEERTVGVSSDGLHDCGRTGTYCLRRANRGRPPEVFCTEKRS